MLFPGFSPDSLDFRGFHAYQPGYFQDLTQDLIFLVFLTRKSLTYRWRCTQIVVYRGRETHGESGKTSGQHYLVYSVTVPRQVEAGFHQDRQKENRPGSPEPLQGGRGQGIQRPPHPTQTAHPGRTGGPIPGPLRGHHGPAVGPQQTLVARQVPAAVFG